MLESLQFVHRDIQCNLRICRSDSVAKNILIASDGSVKVKDLGISKSITATVRVDVTYPVTPYWLAPEIMMSNNYDVKSLIWSIGITMIEMAMGNPPLHHVPSVKAVMKIVHDDAPSLEDEEFSDMFKDFVHICLQKDPSSVSECSFIVHLIIATEY